MREVLRLALSELGYGISTVSNGRDALHHLRTHAETCIIVLDLDLPVMDGVKFRSAQLRDRSLAWIPVVVLSGTPGARQTARDLDARSFVPKPIDLDQVKEALRHIGCTKVRPRSDRSV